MKFTHLIATVRLNQALSTVSLEFQKSNISLAFIDKYSPILDDAKEALFSGATSATVRLKYKDIDAAKNSYNNICNNVLRFNDSLTERVIQVRNTEESNILIPMTVSEAINRINEDRSDAWTNYNICDWVEGWLEWEEARPYSIFDEFGAVISENVLTIQELNEIHIKSGDKSESSTIDCPLT